MIIDLKHSSGVTLLEIMLVLAIIAAIMVGSIRYYQTATAIQQLNTVSSQIIAIVGAAQQLAQPTGSFSAGLGQGTSALAARLPKNTFNTPWGTIIEVSAGSAATVSIKVPGVPASICSLLSERLELNKRFSVTAGTCSQSAPSDMTYTYNVVIQ